MEKREKEVIVYGSHCGDITFFFPISLAQHYAHLHIAYDKGISFAELYDKLPDFFHLIIEYQFDYHYGGGYPATQLEGLSCKEVYRKLIEKLYQEVDHEYDSFEDFIDYYQKIPIEERIPLSSEKFNDTSIPYDILIEIINYGPKIYWAPDEILDKFARTECSIFGYEFTNFYEEDEEELVKAFERAGYRCVKDVVLIAQAHGSELPD